MLINQFLTMVPTYATFCNWFVCIFSRKSWYREVQGSFLSPFHDHFVLSATALAAEGVSFGKDSFQRIPSYFLPRNSLLWRDPLGEISWERLPGSASLGATWESLPGRHSLGEILSLEDLFKRWRSSRRLVGIYIYTTGKYRKIQVYIMVYMCICLG